ncbi:MAG TPA: hypothetical protein VEP66_17875, partial [Myxococcales bacterium]|nr:hypothetical protein [Myxococcales bacterium]
EGGQELRRLNSDLRAQQAKVEKMAQTLFEVVVPSETLRTMFAREEARLGELKRKQTELSLPTEVREAFNLRQAAKAFEDIEQLVDRDPAAGRERLSRYVDQVVFTPVVEDGESVYAAEIVMKSETAALAGGRVAVADDLSCGGRI